MKTKPLTVSPTASKQKRIAAIQQWIADVVNEPLSPQEYLERHVTWSLNSRRHGRNREELITEAIGGWPPSNWKKPPVYMTHLLRLADIVRTLQQHGICKPKRPLFGEKSISLPKSWPLPLFDLQARVIHTPTGGYGTVLGFAQVPGEAEYSYFVLMHSLSPHKPGKRIEVPANELSYL